MRGRDRRRKSRVNTLERTRGKEEKRGRTEPERNRGARGSCVSAPRAGQEGKGRWRRRRLWWGLVARDSDRVLNRRALMKLCMSEGASEVSGLCRTRACWSAGRRPVGSGSAHV